jgi:hypothetical protein
MNLFLQPNQGVAITAWQDQFCEKIHFKFVTKGVAFLSTVEDLERSEVCVW